MGFGINFSGIGDLLGDLAPIAAVAAAPATGGSSLMALAPSAISAGASLLGGMQANQGNIAQSNAANAFSASQSKAQMDFQERMRATQYQTAVEDLKKAGLNPMLAYTQGGAGNLSGASASAASPARLENVAAQAANSAAQSAQFTNILKQNELLSAQINKTDVESDNIMSQTMNNRDINPNIRATYHNIVAQKGLIDSTKDLYSAKAMLANFGRNEAAASSKYYSTGGAAKIAAEKAKGMGLPSLLTGSAEGFNRFLQGLDQ